MGKYLDTDKEALERVKKGIKHWGIACVMASELIVEAKERELWKLEYDSWIDFCEIGCGITKDWARRIIEARRTTKEISEFVDVSDTKSGKPTASGLVPLTPRQADALKGLTIEQKAKIVKASQLGSLKVTEKSLSQARQSLQKGDSAIELDHEGYPIPEPALEFWNRKQEVQDLLTGISRLKGVLEKALEDGDLMFSEVALQRAIIDFGNAHRNVNRAKPYAVCTLCQGKLPDKCTLCKGRGLISKHAWDVIVPKEIKEIRLKSIK